MTFSEKLKELELENSRLKDVNSQHISESISRQQNVKNSQQLVSQDFFYKNANSSLMHPHLVD